MRRRGFPALLAAQALGAYNDNLLKTVISLLLAGRAASAGDGSFFLSLTGVALVAPYLLFSGLAGFIADRLPKRRVLILAKLAEVAIVLVAIPVLWFGHAGQMVAVLFLMASQSAFFSPAKYGILPEMLRRAELSGGNGLLEAARYLAIIVGTASGGLMLVTGAHRLDLIGAVLVGAALIGAAASLGIAATPVAGRAVALRLNPRHGLRLVLAQRSLSFCVLGITVFEALGCLVLLDLILLTKSALGWDDLHVGLLGTCLGLGAALGSALCGRLSGPLARPAVTFVGLTGVGLALLLLTDLGGFRATAATIFAMGAFGGAAIVPLYALLQQEAPAEQKGQIIATNNLVNMLGVLLASLALWVMTDVLGQSPAGILRWSGLGLLVFTALAALRWPEYGLLPFRRRLGRAALALRRGP